MFITGIRIGCGMPQLLFVCLFIASCGCGSPNSAERFRRLQKLANAGDSQGARESARNIPFGDPFWGDAQFILGEIEMKAGEKKAALDCFNAIPRDGSSASIRAADLCASYFLSNCQLSLAAEHLEYVVRQTPQDSTLRSKLATLLVVSGQRVRADQHLMHLLKYGRIELKDLVMLTQPHRQLPEVAMLTNCSSSDSQDPFTRYAITQKKISQKTPEIVRDLLQELLDSHPDLAEAQGMLGELLIDGDATDFETWKTNLPENARIHSHVWYVLGMWSRRHVQVKEAIRCFWESVKRDPCDERAVYQLGQALAPVDPSASAAFQRRAELLHEGSLLSESVLISQGSDVDKFGRLIEILVEIGRLWEAKAWLSSLGNEINASKLSESTLNAVARVKSSSLPRLVPESDLTSIYDFSDFPGPSFESSAYLSDLSLSRPPKRRSTQQFVDEASLVGIDFTYFHSGDSRSSNVRIFESTGGGLGVLDFDRDGWSDIMLTQGEEWPHGQRLPRPSTRYSDALYRNQRTEFVNVASLAGLADDDYGQGCSAGDFNNDGFPDLYIANIGANRLLLNNGDGSFSDVSGLAKISGTAWTTSCVILDLNADGNPDLYDVNYLQGDDVFLVECGKNKCSVLSFEGAQDQVLLSQGDGAFLSVADATPTKNCKGLGLVAVYPDGDLSPSLFIANDQAPNFFLRPADSGKYNDEAIPRGLAFNRNGQSTATMGIASGDINHDQLVDFFVTNFEGEANCFYLQHPGGFYDDAIDGTGLKNPGIPYVGWGTQFIDVDNDGELDVVVANGHVADFGEPSMAYSMPLQLFRNSGMTTFELSPPAETGSLFERKLLGRSIAKVDWNRDGLQDFGLTCIETKFVLATNKSPSAGHWLSVRLHATLSSRDATGAKVELRIAGVSSSQQLTAGDGYQASNERIIHFGIGDATRIENLTIHWPSGATSSFDSVPCNVMVDVSEGISALLVWPQ